MNDEQIQEEGGMTTGGCLLGLTIGACLAFAPPLGLFLAFIWVVIHVWSNNAGPRPDGSMRTPRSLILLRMFGVVLAVSALFFIPIFGPVVIVLGALVAVVIFAAVMWFGQRVVLDFFFRGNNSSYDQFRDSGGDPFFDSLPSVFNPDEHTVRQGGIPEPKYTNPHYVPQPDWDFQCGQCGALCETDSRPCWNCGNNYRGLPPWEHECGRCKVRVPDGHSPCWNCGHGSNA